MKLYYNQCSKWKNEEWKTRLLHSNYQTIKASHTPRNKIEKERIMYLINNARFTGTQESTGIFLCKTSRCSFELKDNTMIAFKVCNFDS